MTKLIINLIKKLLALVFILILCLSLVLAIIISTVDINQYREQIIQTVEKQTGRHFKIDGELKLAYSFIPTLLIEKASFGNPEWASSRDMVKIKRLEIEMALMPLLDKHVSINRIVLDSPEIFLETNKQGKRSWILDTKKPEQGKKEQPTAEKKSKNMPATLPATLNISEVQISNGLLNHRDAASKSSQKIVIKNFKAVSDGMKEPMDISLNASVNSIPIVIAGNTGSLTSLTANEEYAVNIEGLLGKAKISISGKVKRPLQLQGIKARVQTDLKSLSSLDMIAKKPLPNVGPVHLTADVARDKKILYFEKLQGELAKIKISAKGKIKEPYKLKGVELQTSLEADSLTDLTRPFKLKKIPPTGPVQASALVSDTKNGIKFSKFNMQVDKSDLRGTVQISMEKRPALYATINANNIDLAPFLSKEKTGKKGGKLFSSKPLALAWLNKLDAKLEVNARKFKTRKNTLDNLALKLTIENGRLTTTSLKAVLAEGSLSGNIIVDASKPQKIWVNTLINIYQLLPEKLSNLKGEITGGRTDIFIRAKGNGKSVAEIMANLDGQLLVKVGKGNIRSEKFNILDSEIISSALNALLPLPSDKSGRQMICAVTKLDIKDGLAVSDQGIALSTTRMDVVGSGVINLKEETLNIGIKPRAKEGLGISAGSLADLVRITGPISDPKITPDTLEAFKKGLSVGAAFMTGGLSLLAQGLFDLATTDYDPCGTALASGSDRTERENKLPDTVVKPSAPSGGQQESTDDRIRSHF